MIKTEQLSSEGKSLLLDILNIFGFCDNDVQDVDADDTNDDESLGLL